MFSFSNSLVLHRNKQIMTAISVKLIKDKKKNTMLRYHSRIKIYKIHLDRQSPQEPRWVASKILLISSLPMTHQNSIMNTLIWWHYLTRRTKRRGFPRQIVELWLLKKWEGRTLWNMMPSFKLGALVLRTSMKVTAHNNLIKKSMACITFSTCNRIARWARIW